LFDVTDEAYFDRQQLLAAVEIILQRFGSTLSFVTLPELLRQGRPHRVIWRKVTDVDFLNQLRRREGMGRRYGGRKNGGKKMHMRPHSP
jgi:hypothetical protein